MAADCIDKQLVMRGGEVVLEEMAGPGKVLMPEMSMSL